MGHAWWKNGKPGTPVEGYNVRYCQMCHRFIGWGYAQNGDREAQFCHFKAKKRQCDPSTRNIKSSYKRTTVHLSEVSLISGGVGYPYTVTSMTPTLQSELSASPSADSITTTPTLTHRPCRHDQQPEQGSDEEQMDKKFYKLFNTECGSCRRALKPFGAEWGGSSQRFSSCTLCDPRRLWDTRAEEGGGGGGGGGSSRSSSSGEGAKGAAAAVTSPIKRASGADRYSYVSLTASYPSPGLLLFDRSS